MQGILMAIAGLAVPITARVLMALGFSVLTVAGVDSVWGLLKARIISYAGSTPDDVASLLGLGGIWQGLGIILGAMGFAVAYWALTKATRVIGVP